MRQIVQMEMRPTYSGVPFSLYTQEVMRLTMWRMALGTLAELLLEVITLVARLIKTDLALLFVKWHKAASCVRDQACNSLHIHFSCLLKSRIEPLASCCSSNLAACLAELRRS